MIAKHAQIIPETFCSFATPIEPPITWFKIFHFLQLLLICLFQQFSTCIGTLQFGFLMKPPPCNSYYRQVDILPLCQSAADWASEPCSKPIFDLTGVWLTRLHCGPSYHCVRTQMHKYRKTKTQIQIQESWSTPIFTAPPLISLCVSCTKPPLLNKSYIAAMAPSSFKRNSNVYSEPQSSFWPHSIVWTTDAYIYAIYAICISHSKTILPPQ